MDGKIKGVIATLAKLYSKELDGMTLTMYVKFLRQYGLEEIKSVSEYLVKNKKYFPTIAEFIELLDQRIEPEIEAQNLVGRIFQALRQFGYMQPREARHHLGEETWSVVESYGEWKDICALEISQLGVARAQMRDIAKSKLSLKKMQLSAQQIDCKKSDKLLT